MPPAYSFRSHWLLPAPVAEVHAVLLDVEHYPDWWPQVLAVAKLGEDDARVLCRSTLPYTLDLLLHAEHREPELLESSIGGDLVGVVRWRLEEYADGTSLGFEQDVEVARCRLGAASRIARPLLTWNHHRMMAGCLRGLRARVGAPTGR